MCSLQWMVRWRDLAYYGPETIVLFLESDELSSLHVDGLAIAFSDLSHSCLYLFMRVNGRSIAHFVITISESMIDRFEYVGLPSQGLNTGVRPPINALQALSRDPVALFQALIFCCCSSNVLALAFDLHLLRRVDEAGWV